MKAIQSLPGVIGTMLGGNKSTPTPAPPPPIPAPAVAPTPDDAAIQAAQKQQLLAASQRSGRASTILGDSNDSSTDKLGG